MSVLVRKFAERWCPLVYVACWFIYFTIIQRCFKFLFIKKILLDGTLIKFWKFACSTGRGIGRTASDDLSFFLTRQAEGIDELRNKTSINYFPTIIFAPFFLPENSVVVIQDVIPIICANNYSLAKNWLWKFYYPRIARKAIKIITISETSRNDICEHLHIPKSKIVVVPCYIKKFKVDKNVGSLEFQAPFVLFVGTADKHKNLEIIFNALQDNALEKIHFVLVGNKKNIDDAIPKDLHDRVHCIGVVPDTKLTSLLKSATALVYPSIYEGFGLPPFEAALVGCPIICSDIPVLREIWSQNEVLFANPYSSKEWVDAILSTMSKTSENSLRCHNAFVKANKYTGESSRKLLMRTILDISLSIQTR